MPGSSLCRYSPVPGISVAPCCVTRYCSGESVEMAVGFLLNFCMVHSSCGHGPLAGVAQRGPRMREIGVQRQASCLECLPVIDIRQRRNGDELTEVEAGQGGV